MSVPDDFHGTPSQKHISLLVRACVRACAASNRAKEGKQRGSEMVRNFKSKALETILKRNVSCQCPVDLL